MTQQICLNCKCLGVNGIIEICNEQDTDLHYSREFDAYECNKFDSKIKVQIKNILKLRRDYKIVLKNTITGKKMPIFLPNRYFGCDRLKLKVGEIYDFLTHQPFIDQYDDMTYLYSLTNKTKNFNLYYDYPLF